MRGATLTFQTCRNFHAALGSSRAVYSARIPARSPPSACLSFRISERASSEGNLSCWKKLYLGCALVAGMAIGSSAQTVNTIHNFNGSDGSNPANLTLVQGRDAALYGATDRKSTRLNSSHLGISYA